jgi:hypothetical protein
MPTNKKNRSNKKSKSKKQQKLEFGRSYFDILPDGVLDLIYNFKHQLEFNPVINEFKKVEDIAIDNNLVDTNTGVLKLLKPIKEQKRLFIQMKPFKTDDVNETIYNKDVKEQYLTKKISITKSLFNIMDHMVIDFYKKTNLTAIDILKIIFDCGIRIKDVFKIRDILNLDLNNNRSATIKFIIENN